MKMESAPVYFLFGCDVDSVKQHLQLILDQLLTGEKVSPVVISCKRQFVSFTNIQGLPQYLMSLCRQHNLLKNERVSLLSYMDQLIALQLCLAEKNKQDRGDFDVETSVVVQAGKDIVNRKLYDVTSCTEADDIYENYQKMLENCNYTDLCDIINTVQQERNKNEELHKELNETAYVFLDVPKYESERHGLKFLCEGRQLQKVTVEFPLDSSAEDVTLSHIDTSLEDAFAPSFTASTVKKPASITEAYVRQVYLSYLELLINSRSELALARVINVPERDLSHTAFTDIKHEAKLKSMPMYQTAVSYVMKIRLGGKGYAPDPNSKMAAHVKGIGEFIDVMHRMETVVEEDPNIRSGCQRAVNIIRKEMLKCRDSKIRKSSVESVSEQLQEQISSIIDDIEAVVAHSPDKPACNGGSLTGRKTRRALCYLLDKLTTLDDDLSTLDHLWDIYSSQRTPIRFQSLLSQFRSPDDEPDSPDEKCNTSLAERMMNKNILKQTPVYAKRYKSDMDWAEPTHSAIFSSDDHIFTQSEVVVLPSKTLVHASSKTSSLIANKVLESMLDQENITDDNPPMPIANQQKPEGQKVSKKRPLQSAPSSQPEKKKKQEASKTCRRKLLPQVKGQQQLTKFFRV